jgi:hypothetical protein
MIGSFARKSLQSDRPSGELAGLPGDTVNNTRQRLTPNCQGMVAPNGALTLGKTFARKNPSPSLAATTASECFGEDAVLWWHAANNSLRLRVVIPHIPKPSPYTPNAACVSFRQLVINQTAQKHYRNPHEN